MARCLSVYTRDGIRAVNPGGDYLENVIVYSTGCPRCKILKKKLAEKGISFTENSSTEEMLKLGITEVPVLQLDTERLDFSHAVQWVNNQ